MKKYVLFLILAGTILSCKKNSQNSTLSGVYAEVSPEPGNILLDFTSSSYVSIAEKDTINQTRLPLGAVPYQISGKYVVLISTTTGKPYTDISPFVISGKDSLVFFPCCCGLPCPAGGGYVLTKIFTQ
jgi:hypothetical protein